MRSFVFAILAILSLVVCVLSWGTLLRSCSGHPPNTIIGGWILPASLLGAGLFLYLPSLFWRMRLPDQEYSVVKEAFQIAKKFLVFFISFIAITLSFFIFTQLILYMVLNTSMPNWVLYVMYALEAVLSLYIGAITYRALNKAMPNKAIQPDAP